MNTDKPMYGLWIVNQGWIKGENKDAIVFADYSFALEASKHINAQVRRIDDSWKDLERFYLQQEERNKGKSLWHIFKTYLQFKTNK